MKELIQVNQSRRISKTRSLGQAKLTSYRLLKWRQKGFDTIGRRKANQRITPPANMQAPPEHMQTPPESMHAKLIMKLNASAAQS